MEHPEMKQRREDFAEMGFHVGDQLRYNGRANYACAIATSVNTIVLLVIVFLWAS